MTIRLKLIIACLAFALITGALGQFGRAQDAKMAALALNFYDQVFIGIDFSHRAHIAFLRLAASPSQAAAAIGPILDRLDVAIERAGTDRAREAGQAVRAKLVALQRGIGDPAAAIAAIDADLGQLGQRYAADGFALRSRADALVDQNDQALLIGIGIAIALALLVAILLERSIVPPVKQAARIAGAIAGGQLDTVIPVGGRSETDRLLTALAEMQAALRENIERVKTEAALRHAKDEAEAATKAKSSFLAMMSHEIRTPMNGVMSMAEMLDETDLSDDQRSMCRTIRSSAEALLTIINDLLDFSKIEADKLDIENLPFSLLGLVEDASELIATRADEKSLGLIVDLDPALPDQVIGDPTRIRQILLNLLSNAVKFTEHGRVTVEVGYAPGIDADAGVILRFAVSDTGIGLSDEQRARLFQPFTQADASTNRRFGGTGLGLSICHRLCRLMGGRIGVQSILGQGSSFWFELPLTPVDGAVAVPRIPIGDTRIIAIGFSDPDQSALAKVLGWAGIVAINWYGADDPVLPIGALSPVALVSGAVSLSNHRRLQELAASFAAAGVSSILIAPRRLASTIQAAGDSGFFTTLTTPLRRTQLCHAIAAALGQAEPDRPQPVSKHAQEKFLPPPLDVAHAAEAVILVAEDNRTNQIVISRLLTQLGYAHEIADDGRAALALWQERRYGLLLTDFHMPAMNGFELTRAVRLLEAENPDARRRPIVALTADALPGTSQHCLDAGMDGYLTKPINRRMLSETLALLLPEASPLRRPLDETAPPERRHRPDRRKSDRYAVADGDDERPVPFAGLPPIDPQIFDLTRLTEAFGGWSPEARQFLAYFLSEIPALIEDVNRSLAENDAVAARDAAHSLKGAARSAGAVRLGQIASDVQDCLDGADHETAAIMAALLTPTLTELIEATIQLCRA